VLLSEDDVHIKDTDDVLSHVAVKSLKNAYVFNNFRIYNDLDEVTLENFDCIWEKASEPKSTPARLILITGPPKTFAVLIPDDSDSDDDRFNRYYNCTNLRNDD
jgi:hypothetical protein